MNAPVLESPAAVAPPASAARLPLSRVLVLVGLMLLAAATGVWLRPDYRLSEHKPAIALATQVPEAFGEWKIDRTLAPVVPDPSLQSALDALYSQTLARTYVNAAGERVMLSIAYGSDQSSETTAVHRPEFCYSAQGFRVRRIGETVLHVGPALVPAARLVANLGPRIEPITYWVTLDEAATLPGWGRKLEQLRYGLRGQIPDGMLVRVSAISSSIEQSYALQQRFLEQMYAAIPTPVRTRYFGGDTSSGETLSTPEPSRGMNPPPIQR
ncbi:MAG: EpsI family protein [Burkholderiales bacterium]|nr:EpsI family protein [Burkholderiales bacterium]